MNQFSDQNNKTESESHTADERFSRRGVLKAGIAAGAGVAALAFGQGQSLAQRQPGKATLSDHTMVLDRKDTALVVVDPQNEVLSEKGLISVVPKFRVVAQPARRSEHGSLSVAVSVTTPYSPSTACCSHRNNVRSRNRS